ncbi:MAG: ATP-binding protein [Bacilli bacterium]|nr:ATP-binding protein [Bacilli bacterium]
MAVKDNRQAFSRAITPKMSLPFDYVYPDWKAIFAAILSFYKGKRGILVIDEYPYIATHGSGFSSYLQDFIDNHAKDTQLMILLSISSFSFMEKEMKTRTSPLYKRKTFSMKIKPLVFKNALAFLNGTNLEEKAKYLSLFGCHPYCLSLINKKASFEENLLELVYAKEGPLLDAPNDVLTTSIRESAFYNSILSSISKGFITSHLNVHKTNFQKEKSNSF